MRNGTLAIYDSDVSYLHHLSEYLRLRDDFPYDILVFNDLEALNKYSLGTIDILITSFIPDFICKKDIGDIFYLCNDDSSTYNDYVCLSKYKPADLLLRQIMETCGSNSLNSSSVSNNSCLITGIYSPVNRCGKTSLALSLGLKHSKTEPTLLISFDNFSIISSFVEDACFRDISDLMFYFLDDEASLETKILSMSYKLHELSFISPPVSPSHFKDISDSDWCRLIKAISDSGIYKNIILDISNSFLYIEDFFSLCDTVLVPQLDDFISTGKIDSFFEYLSHISSINTNIFKKISLPLMDSFSSKSAYISYLVNNGGVL